jgi:hypothetical protein
MLRPPDEPPAGPADAHRGEVLAKTCDRRKQEQDFKTFFKLCNDGRRGHAQFYVIHGREKEGHKSLVERFCATAILNRAGGVKPTPWTPGWPQTGNLRVDAQQLVSLLFEQAGRDDVPGELSARARAFRGVAASLPPVVVIMHEIKAGDWLRTTRRLIRSYVEFWDEVKRADGDGPLPLFVVFLNVVYPVFRDRSPFPQRQWRTLRHRLNIARVRLGLRLLSRLRGRSPLASPAPQRASFALLKELTCVGVEDVKDWLGNHGYGALEGQLDDKSRGIFLSNRWELFECRSMADVEWALSKYVAEATPMKGAYT